MSDSVDYLVGCTIPGCCQPTPCDVPGHVMAGNTISVVSGVVVQLDAGNVWQTVRITESPTAEDFHELARWMDARVLVTARKRGHRLPGRLRLARLRLWQAFVGLA